MNHRLTEWIFRANIFCFALLLPILFEFSPPDESRLFRIGTSVILLIVIFPSLTNLAASIIGIQDNVNAGILAGFILVFLMIFKLLSAIERLEQQISLLTRKDALREIEQPDRNDTE